jgi:hypothetical protein
MNNVLHSQRKLRSSIYMVRDESGVQSSDRPLSSKRKKQASTLATRMFKGVPVKGASPSPRRVPKINPIEKVDTFLQNYENFSKLMGSSRRARIQSAKQSMLSLSDRDSEKITQENLKIKAENALLKQKL